MALKVLHLSTYRSGGGAARAATNVNSALQQAGVDSQMMTACGTRFKVARAADRSLWKLQRSPVKTWRSPARFGSLSATKINASPADVINLHWVTDGFLSIKEIGKIRKPVVVSMYDMWSFCGTEHYCEDSPNSRWRNGYRANNRPESEFGIDLDRLTWQQKLLSWKPMHMVAASTWLEQATRESRLCQGWPAHRVPHPLGRPFQETPSPIQARDFLGLDRHLPIIGFVASSGTADRRKGFDLLENALPNVVAAIGEVQLLVVGPANGPNVENHLVRRVSLSGVSSDAELSLIYSACDVIAVPSRTDHMPLVAMEAQFTGRPVVAFDVAGLPDIVRHMETGYLARPFDTCDLATGITLAVTDSRSARSWEKAALLHSRDQWSADTIASSYLQIYERAVHE